MLKKIFSGAIIGGIGVFGLVIGGGQAEAKIEPGHYKHHYMIYGVIPTPESNVVVIGNKAYTDFWGMGAWNQYPKTILPTKNGGVMYTGHTATDRFLQRDEYTQRTKDGYKGKGYAYNISQLTTHLRKVAPPRR